MRKVSTLPGDAPPPAAKPRRQVNLTDAIMVGAGVGLAVAAALFPWYIFMNQEKFGPPAMRFEGGGSGTPPAARLSPQPSLVGRPMEAADVPSLDLDLISTATPAPPGQAPEAVSLSEQPFPDGVDYRLVHVANGRAMIADDVGFWVVQPGSRLPDNSRVAAIEQREGAWVLVTSTDRVVRLSP